MIWYAFAFLFGNVFLHQLAELPSLLWSAIILLACGVSTRYFSLRILAMFVLGFCYAWLTAEFRTAEIRGFDGVGPNVSIQLKIISIPVVQSRRILFDAEVLETQEKIPSRLRLSLYEKGAVLKLGETISAQVRLKPIRGYSNPGSFDYERYLFANGIGATGYIRAWERQSDKTPNLYHTVRQWMYDRLNEKIKHLDNRGAILALTFGERRAMLAWQWQALTRSGVGHLFAISGLHITLLYGFAYLLFAWIWRCFFIQRFYIATPLVASITAFPIALFYAALAGFAIPTQRALLMLACFIMFQLFRYQATLVQTLSFALCIVLLYDPFASLSLSFWFSFLAVLGIIVFTSATRTSTAWIRANGLVFCLPLILLPISLLFFKQASFIAPIANLFAVPYASFLMVPVSLLTVVASSLFPMFADTIIKGADYLLNGLWFALKLVNAIPYAQHLHSPEGWSHALAWLGLAMILTTRLWSFRLFGIVLICALWLPSENNIPATAFTASFLDVGQGSAMVIQTRHHTLVYDSGARFSEKFDLGESVVVPYLLKQGIRRLDALIISHSDNDHSGGATAILQTYPTQQKYIGGNQTEKWQAQNFQKCQRGHNWVWDGVYFSFLHPDSKMTSSTDNDGSCVLKIDNGKHSVLLTGDIELTAEIDLLHAMKDELRADLMSVPHHGSMTSSSQAFIQAVQPQIAIASSGFRNRFNFPRPKVVERYTSACIRLYNTAETGAIRVVFPPINLSTNMQLTLYRQEHSNYWQSKQDEYDHSVHHDCKV